MLAHASLFEVLVARARMVLPSSEVKTDAEHGFFDSVKPQNSSLRLSGPSGQIKIELTS